MNPFLFALFAIFGALFRYSLELLLPFRDFPVGTLTINLTGCFLLAFVTRFLIWVPKLPTKMVTAIGTGFIGSFTTFSTFTLETVRLLERGAYLTGAAYLAISCVGGLTACLLGYRGSLMLLNRRKRRGKVC